MWGHLSTTCRNLLKRPNVELLVAVDRNQVRTMASETADPIDWSHPHPHGQYPHERLVHSINQCSLSMESTPQPSACEATTFPLRPLRVLSEKILLPYQAAKTIIACGHHYQRLPRVPSEIFSSLPLAS